MLVTAFFPVTKVESDSEPVDPIPISVNIENIFSDPAPKTITITLGESEYTKKIAAEEAEKKRLADEAAAKAKAQQRAKLTVKTATKTTALANTFPSGWCTSYAASRFPVTWRGNAGQWTTNAASQGYKVDKVAEAGALLVTWENSLNCYKCGHVAVIDKVENGLMYISEMNYVRFGVVSTRVLPANSTLIKGVIHRL